MQRALGASDTDGDDVVWVWGNPPGGGAGAPLLPTPLSGLPEASLVSAGGPYIGPTGSQMAF